MIITMMLGFILLSDSVQTVVVESSAALFMKAVSLASFPDGKLMVVDQGSNTVNIIGPKNTIDRSIGGQGWGSESLDTPTDVASSFLLDLFVVDYNNRRVQRFDKRLHFIQSLNEESISFSRRFQPIAAAVSPQGELFVLDGDNNVAVKIGVNGRIEREFGTLNDSPIGIVEPKDIAVSAGYDVCVLDGSRSLIFDIYGNFKRTIDLAPASDWKTISITDNILVATSSTMITLIDLVSSEQRTITSDFVIGEGTIGPFNDALFSGNRLIIITDTTLLRCVLH